MLQLIAPDRVVNASIEPPQHIEVSEKAIAPQLPSPTQDAIENIRTGLRDIANETAHNIQQLSQATVEQAIDIGQRLWRMQRNLKRKEYGAFLGVLGWATTKARKFINLAKVFDGFSPSQLIRVELTTLLSLCSKRYQQVMTALREIPEISQQMVEQLIKENRQVRAPKQEPVSGWKQNRVGGTRRYEVILHDEKTAVSIEQQALSEEILPQKVIAEAVALRSQHKSNPGQINEYYAAQLEELQTVVEHARSLNSENRKLAHQLMIRDRMIAELEAKVATEVASDDVKLNDVKKLGVPCSVEAESTDDEVAIASTELCEYLEEQVLVITSYVEHTTELESQTAGSSDYPDPQQKSEYLDQGKEHDCLVKKEQDRERVGPESQVFQSGCSVQIISSRQGDEFVGLLGFVLVANTAGCVVEVLDKTKWFCSDEIALVLQATQLQPG